MNPNKALWEKGDFTRIAATMRESGEALVAGLGITPGLKVLDLGCGDGTTALPAARLGADVLGVDIASNLVEAGNRRAQAEGLTNCRFQEGDATNLSDLADQSFDLVVSIFGAMFAPKPFDVAKEMVRVTRPGGRIVMGNWIPERSDARRADPEDQLRLLAAAARGLCQPHDVGDREQRDRAICGSGGSSREDLVLQRHVYLQVSRLTVCVCRRLQKLLRAHDERVRRRRTERQSRGSSAGARGPLRAPEQERGQRRHVDSCDLPARHRRRLSSLTCTAHDADSSGKESSTGALCGDDFRDASVFASRSGLLPRVPRGRPREQTATQQLTASEGR